jgi:hypothetical protein
MRHIEDNIKEKRSKQYNKWARKYPSYISLIIPIILGISIGVDDYMESKVWGRAIIYIMSISTFSTALFFLLRFTLRDISKFYPEMIIFCDRLKPTSRILYSNDSSYSEDQKTEIRKKIKLRRNIDLLKYKTKTYKNKKYVKRVDEAVAWLLDVTRFDDILFEQNCLYGFWRNLTAALLVDAILVFPMAAINKWYYALPFEEHFVRIGLLILLLTIPETWVAYCNGRTFAKRMYDVFVNLDDNDNNY